jgi:REP-associated tyrosine transposase
MSITLPCMYLTPFTSLVWAYQLHYYICFRTHRRRAVFTETSNVLSALVKEICLRHDYHLLECKPYPDQFRFLVSLPPSRSVANVIQTIKTNSARECGLRLALTAPVWARGYLARSTGRMRIGAVRQYLEQQASHHGYSNRLLPPVYRYRTTQPLVLTSAHARFELNHHLVFATCRRVGVFTSALGDALSGYWLRAAAKHGFAIDQISVVPDHVHLMVRIVPKMSIERCALLLLNNGQHFIGKHFPQALVEVGIDQLWQPSAYAGTCGEITTALINEWLSECE